jgi:hypothetical protein
MYTLATFLSHARQQDNCPESIKAAADRQVHKVWQAREYAAVKSEVSKILKDIEQGKDKQVRCSVLGIVLKRNVINCCRPIVAAPPGECSRLLHLDVLSGGATRMLHVKHNPDSGPLQSSPGDLPGEYTYFGP